MRSMKTRLDNRPPLLLTVGAVVVGLYLPVLVFVAPVFGHRPTIDWNLEGIGVLGVTPGLWLTLTIGDHDPFVMAGVFTALLGSFAVWVGRTWFSLGLAASTVLGWSAFSAHWLSVLLWKVH